MSSKEPVPNVKRKISIKEHGIISFKFGGGIFLLAIFIGYVFLKLVPDGNVKVRTLGICIIFLCWLWSSYWLNWLFPEKFNYEIDHDINKFSQIVRKNFMPYYLSLITLVMLLFMLTVLIGET